MQRYALWKASTFDKPTERMLQIAEAHDLLPLLEAPFYLIGTNDSRRPFGNYSNAEKLT